MGKLKSIFYGCFVGVILCLISFGPPAYGQEQDSVNNQKTEQNQTTVQDNEAQEKNAALLGEMVVTATRFKTPLEEIPASVTVIDREQIKRSSGLRLDHILRKYAGIDIQRSSIVTHSAEVVMRGMGSEMDGRTLILLDGQPLNKADTGSVNWDLLLPDNVEKIEIVRGPVSSLYGSNAMGGVINIISREPDDKPVNFEARGGYGTWNTSDAGVTLSGKYKKFGYYVSYDKLKSDGYNPVPKDERDEYSVDRTLEEDHFRSKISYELTDKSKISFGYLFFDDKRGEGTKIRHQDGVYRKWKTNAYSLEYELSTGAVNWNLKGFYNKEDYFWNRETLKKGKYTRYKVDVDRVDAGGSIQATFPVLSRNLVTTGFDFKYGSVDGGDNYVISNDKPSDDVVHNEGKQNTYSFFVNDHIKIGRKMTLDAGFRYDYVEGYDGSYSDSSGFLQNQEYENKTWDHLSPRVAAMYRITDNFSVRGSVGTAFRAPILDDLYRDGILRGKIYAANPELGPEKLISYEAGMDYSFRETVSLHVTGYFSEGDDFFYPIKTGIDPGTGRDLYQRKNVGKVHIYGVEFEADWDINRMFTLFGNYTHNISKIKQFDEQPELEGKYLENTPRHKANLGLSFHHPDIFTAEIVGRYIGERYGDSENTPDNELDDYVTFDLKVSRYFSKYIEAYIDIQNIFDRDIVLSSDYEGPGAEIRGGVTVRF